MALEGLDVIDPETMKQVPADGETIGEVMFRGNIVMNGYLKNNMATNEAFAGGWFHSGDLGVIYPDGYIQLKDRTKDIIISGGENISSIEVEDVLYNHPGVLFVAVVASPMRNGARRPCAFIEKARLGGHEDEILPYCPHTSSPDSNARAWWCLPKLPKTSTGKIQKFILREMAKEA